MDAVVIRRLLGTLSQYILELNSERTISHEQFVHDLKTRRFVEHTLQIAIQACLDIAAHIIAEEGWREPSDYKDAFAVLCENGIVSRDFLLVLQKMAQFRNLMVHQYVKLDSEVVWRVLVSGVADLEKYASDIAKWVSMK